MTSKGRIRKDYLKEGDSEWRNLSWQGRKGILRKEEQSKDLVVAFKMASVAKGKSNIALHSIPYLSSVCAHRGNRVVCQLFLNKKNDSTLAGVQEMARNVMRRKVRKRGSVKVV